MACDLYYSENIVKDDLERVQDWRQEDLCKSKTRSDQDLNLEVALGSRSGKKRDLMGFGYRLIVKLEGKGEVQR